MRSVATKKGYNQIPTDGITDPTVLQFIAGLQTFLQRHQQQNYDDINNLQLLELVATASVPTASSSLRGKMILVDGGAGVADVLQVCSKKSDNLYYWRVVTIT